MVSYFTKVAACGRVDKSPDCGSQGLRFKSHRGTSVLGQDIDLHLPLSTQVLNEYPVGCES